MFSSAFLHVDFNHLFFNLFTLYVFSSSIITKVGDFYYLAIYILSLYFGNYYTLHLYKKNHYYSAAGASGAVTGIVYSSILLFPEMKLVFIFLPIPLPSYLIGVGYIIYSIYGMKKNNDNIGHSAHLGGAIAGILLTIIIEPSILIEQTWLVILLISPFILLKYLKK
jgi:membrane associated rhomboid family serine protease